MGASKTEHFSKAQNEFAQIAKALAHPARIAILEHLFAIQSCVCGDLVEETGLAQPTVSQHLKELKNAGILKGRTEGTSICYCIDPERWKEISERFSAFFAHDPGNLNCC